MIKNKSHVKLPENIKPVGKKTVKVSAHDEFNFSTMCSLNWLGITSSTVGFTTIPMSNILFIIPCLTALLTFLPFIFIGCEIFLDDRLGKYQRAFQKLNTQTLRVSTQQAMEQSGMSSTIWTKNSFASVAHLLLPFRIFRKVRLHEAITYFPVEDKYVKETHYLTFGRWIKVEETFEGQRAVFKKAIDAF